ncbi:endonuclease/exonuclease/phosphatase family protein [Halosquirtibacter xylanolyticus]|uniref:endonuclease/exonuclease/phosphatase family protein n=1 Tax=Halosquirtibacter xylanolyticus TaxID=3374599 RepID=UPI003748B2B9|nr:endonuclease/exonuclease/phosphatase family protein [Prolixibacteraceae bacterium]
MNRRILLSLYLFLLLAVVSACTEVKKEPVRFATFNAALNRLEKGMLLKDLSLGCQQAKNVASIIQITRPDVLCLQEFDFDASGEALEVFMTKYLQSGDHPIEYPYHMLFTSNTGVLSKSDINNDGKLSLPSDGYGFGAFEGQYAFVILSKYPIMKDDVRTFQNMKWEQMPDPNWPVSPDGISWFNDEEKKDLRISSKNHVDVPIDIDGHIVHAIIAHPTPPVFDGKEDRNGRRNFDEIRMIKDYVEGADYMVDDKGSRGALGANASFVIMGDMNADPYDGDSYRSAIVPLLKSQRLNSSVTFGDKVPKSLGAVEFNKKMKYNHKGDDAMDTNVFGLRIDYVLPSSDLNVLESRVYWNEKKHKDGTLTFNKNSSDHRMVWADIQFSDDH